MMATANHLMSDVVCKLCLTVIDPAQLSCKSSRHCGRTLDSGVRCLTSTIMIDRVTSMAVNCTTVSSFCFVFYVTKVLLLGVLGP